MAPKSRPLRAASSPRRVPAPRARAGAKRRALLTVERLKAVYPAVTELRHDNPYQLLVATILSAQTTDRMVNLVTPELFDRFPTAADLAAADPAQVERIVKPTGFFRNKTKAIILAARALVDRFAGDVPRTLEELLTVPGIGRKTANVILGVGFDVPGFAVDTHVTRLTNRLGLVDTRDPVKIEAAVCRLVPAPEWTGLSLRLILHGRRVCFARRPNCEGCVLNDYCPSSTVRPAPLRRAPSLPA